MAVKTYIVTNPAGANLRLHPSGSYPTANPVKRLAIGTSLTIITDWTSTNTVGAVTTYLPVRDGDKVLYVDERTVAPYSRLLSMELFSREVYGAIYECKVKHTLGKGALIDEIVSSKQVDCAGAVSASMALAGMIKAGTRISHTAAGGVKDSPEKAIKGLNNLIPGTFTIVKANKLFKDLKADNQAAGMIYVQDSNICVSAGGGKVYSCNKTGKRYGKGGEPVLRTDGYPFTSKILYIIKPKG